MKKLYFLFIALLMTTVSFGQMTTVLQESFETDGNGTRYTTSVPEFTDNFNDFFLRTDGSTINSNYEVSNQDGTFFFAAMDTDGDGNPTTITLNFDDIDISTFTNLTFLIGVAEDDDGTNEDWDDGSSFIVEVDIDNSGSFSKVLQFEAISLRPDGSTSTSNKEPALDTDFDGVGDGTRLSPVFQDFTAAIGTGSLIDIKLTFTNLKNGDEDIAIDNIRLVNNFAASPSMVVTPGSLNGLKYVVGSGPSAEQTFTVSGADLTADISITAPTNFEISTTSGGSFGASFNLRMNTGIVITTTVYTRLKTGLALNSSYTGDVTISTTGTTDKTVALSGGVFSPPTNAMVITGVFDAQDGSSPKGVELLVIKNIPDLSIFGVESANNGGGASGQEFTFPAVAATQGQILYIVGTGQEAKFATFFGTGFTADYASDAMFINGDDAIVLYENTQVIDLFGDINLDGSGTAWDYVDGWAYRVANTGPSSTFTIGNWTFSGTVQLDATTNAASTIPFPAKTYTNTLAISQQQLLDGFSLYPNPVRGGLLNVQSPSNTVKNISIFDVIGKQVYQRNTTKNQINISNLKAGLYFVKVQQDGKMATRKLVVE